MRPLTLVLALGVVTSGCGTYRFAAPVASPDVIARHRTTHTFRVLQQEAPTTEVCSDAATEVCIAGLRMQLLEGASAILASIAQPVSPGDDPEFTASFGEITVRWRTERYTNRLEVAWTFLLLDRAGHVVVRATDTDSAPFIRREEEPEALLHVENAVMEHVRASAALSRLGQDS